MESNTKGDYISYSVKRNTHRATTRKDRWWFFCYSVTLLLIGPLFILIGYWLATGTSTNEVEDKQIHVIVNIDSASAEKEPDSGSDEQLQSNIPIEPQIISRDFDILQPCGYSYEQLAYALSGDSHSAMLPYVGTFLEAENEYGVNAFYLMCQLGLESGWCREMAATNNIGGWMNDDGCFREFESIEKCIFHIAENLSTEYKEAVGSNLENVCERYCPGSEYSDVLIQIMRERAYKISEMYANDETI